MDLATAQPAIAYSAAKVDLFFPAKQATFFAPAVLKSEAALCADMARLAYCHPDSSFSFDRQRISAELDRAGFTALRFFESQGKPNGEGTHCFLAVRKDKQFAVVSFRGTDRDDPTDVAADANALRVPWEVGGTVHRGFALALADVRADLEQALSSITCPLLYTGHSLSAALATLLASLKRPDALYTIGSPLVGDTDFVATLNGIKSFRYVDCCDIVTQIPPTVLGYAHLGSPYYIDRQRIVKFNPADIAIDEDRIAATAEFPFIYAWKGENVGARQLADHAPVNYVLPIAAEAG